MNCNPNKIIKLYHNGTNTSDIEDTSWRNNLNRIMNSKETNIYNPIVGGDLSKWTVNSNIDLLIPDRIPSLATGSTSNFDDKAIENLLKKFSSALEKVAGTVLLPASLSTLSKSSTFLTLANMFMSLDSSKDSGYMLDPWWTRIPTYTKTPSPLEFTCQFNFSLGQYGLWNALEEVVKPILNLAAPSMVRLINGAGFYTPFPTIEKLAINAIGQAFDKLFDMGEATRDEAEATSGAMDVVKPSTYNIKFGNALYFPNVIMKVAEDIKLSSEVDQHGYPVQGSITLLFSCLTPMSLTAVRPDLMATRFFYTPQDK